MRFFFVGMNKLYYKTTYKMFQFDKVFEINYPLYTLSLLQIKISQVITIIIPSESKDLLP